ncbi:MAG TPA: protein kinase [Vicinamibacterales bacterium]|nr:protein kinase [Vicinamibacterales bacterium]
MRLRAADRLGPYEIVGLLGNGAVGEVYRARDTRLGRDVAVKVLRSAFINDANRLARFKREGRLLSQVSHSNICTLFDIFEFDNAPVLVLELVEGETLQQRLLRGPMRLRESLRCASAIAAALEAAHRKGIIHRDLKPSNVKLADSGTVKVLDFGVATLAYGADADLGAADLTQTLGGTKERALVGTVAYVSPEQAMGDRVDARSDIWAFGCLLYEMLTARRAFPGVAVADTLGAVMRGEPDWTALSAETPRQVRTLLRRCLEKDRARRLADIGDAKLEVDDLLAGRLEDGPVMHSAARPHRMFPASRPRWLVVASAFVAGVIVATVMTGLFNRPPQTVPPVAENPPTVSARPPEPLKSPAAETRVEGRQPPPPSAVAPRAAVLEAVAGGPHSVVPPADGKDRVTSVPALINLPAGMTWPRAADGPDTILAISPDGGRVVFSARLGQRALWLRSLAADDLVQLPGTEDGVSPFWSPDSSSIGFFANGRLKRLDVGAPGTRSRDGWPQPVNLSEAASQRGGAWGPDNTIVFSRASGGLKRISANGGIAAEFTYREPGEADHFRPQFLAGTRYVLYRVTSSNGRNNRYYVTSLDSSERKLIATLDSGNVVYAQGHLFFMQTNTLMAQPFDTKNLTVTGPPRPITAGVLLSTGSAPVFGVFSVSQAGRVVYLSQGSDRGPLSVIANWTVLR